MTDKKIPAVLVRTPYGKKKGGGRFITVLCRGRRQPAEIRI